MNKTRTQHYTEAVLAGLLLVTYTVSVIGVRGQELTDQGLYLEQIHNDLQTMLKQLTMEIEKSGQSSIPLRGFYDTHLFSCRGLA